MKTALITVDFINDIVHADGRLASAAEVVAGRQVIAKVNAMAARFRSAGQAVVHVGLALDPDPSDGIKRSPLFQHVIAAGACLDGTWGAEFHSDLEIESTDLRIRKTRVSAFTGNDLAGQLRSLGVDSVTLAGVSTEMAVVSTGRQAHDLDFELVIAGDCCASADAAQHRAALDLMRRVARIVE
jgi:nicotinamidase-related amidase